MSVVPVCSVSAAGNVESRGEGNGETLQDQPALRRDLLRALLAVGTDGTRRPPPRTFAKGVVRSSSSYLPKGAESGSSVGRSPRGVSPPTVGRLVGKVDENGSGSANLSCGDLRSGCTSTTGACARGSLRLEGRASPTGLPDHGRA